MLAISPDRMNICSICTLNYDTMVIVLWRLIVARREAQLEYGWQRRWIPVDVDQSSNTDRSRRAREALATWQLRDSTDGVAFGRIRHVPCLVLLGEPGMGKSYFLRREKRHVDSCISSSVVTTQWVDLVGCGSIENIRTHLFESDQYRDWKTGAHRLTMFVDSVDQAGIPVKQVIAAIGNELSNVDICRLHLRLVCRDYDWSLSLADALGQCWRNNDEAPVRVYQLAPLNADDIRLAAEANGKNADAFINEIENANALPLAMIPITLEMLLQTNEMTDSRIDLYRSGIRRLCGLPDGRVPLTEKARHERFDMAARIAAVMVLGNKKSIDIDGSAALNESSLGVPELLHDRESEDEERLLRSTLNCALFKDTKERIWSHQSFAEYLAAYFLSQDNVSVDELIWRTTTPDGKFAPQLHEMLRWLMDMRTDFLKEVAKRQPMLVLMSDLSHLSEGEYRSFATTLLGLDDTHVYSSETRQLRNYRATHPESKRVLLPYLNNTDLDQYLRRFVFRLLECHGLHGMEEMLVDLAFSECEDSVLRRWAARGIEKLDNVEAKLELKPYALGREDDPDDEIKGYALQALWPDHLTAVELFNALTPPKRENLLGSYRVFFIENSIVDDLKSSDLPTALEWVDAQPAHHEMSFALQDLPGKIMRKAWDNRHIPGVLESFAKTALNTDRLRFDGLFGRYPNTYPPDKELDEFENAFVQETQYRRELVLMCLPLLSASDEKVWRLADTWPPIIVPDDLDWLLGLLESETDEMRREQLADLVARLCHSDIEKVYYASERHPEVKQRTKHYFVSRLDDPNVISDRKHFRKIKEIKENRKRELADVRPFERIQKALKRFEAGETLQWLNVVNSLGHRPDGSVAPWNFNPDLTAFPLWKFCDKDTHYRVQRAATTYVNEQDSLPPGQGNADWFVSRTVPNVEMYGYLALFLLLKESPGTLGALLTKRWERWSKIIVWQPYCNPFDISQTEYRNDVVRLQNELIGRLYRSVPESFLQLFALHLNAEEMTLESTFSKLDKVESIWDTRIEQILVNGLRDTTLSAETRRHLLDRLLKHQCADAVRIAEECIAKRETDDVEREHLVELSIGLIQSQVAFNWSAVWDAMTSNDEFGRAIVENSAGEIQAGGNFGEHLSARELADLFLWIEERYPSAEDPQIDGAHMVSTREQVGHWRNSLINQIRAKDSQDGLREIRRIIALLPQLEWLNMVRIDLEKAVEESSLLPLAPREVIELPMTIEEQQIRKSPTVRDFLKDHWKWIIPALLTVFAILVTVLAIVVSILLPEIRQSLGLETDSTAKPAQSVESATAEAQPHEIVDGESHTATVTVSIGDSQASPKSTEETIAPQSDPATTE